MKFVLLFAFATFTTVYGSTCISTVSTVPVPRYAEAQIKQAESVVAAITSVGSTISTAELSSPSLSFAESVIESYVYSYYSLIGSVIWFYQSPSAISTASLAEYTCLTSAYTTLATAISEVVSFEETHPSFATAQSDLMSVELTQTSILTALAEYTAAASPSVYEASNILSEATLSSPSIVASIISIYTADIGSPSVQSALSFLSWNAYSVPSYVVSEIITYIESPSTVPSSVIASLDSCYSSLYSALSVVTGFTSSHPSVVSAITDFISAASSVSSLSSAVSTIISEQMPTLVYDVGVVSQVTITWPSFTTDIEILSGFTATSPTLSCDLKTMEQSLYNSPTIAASIYNDLLSPSIVVFPQQLSQEEMSHSSLVSAIESIISWESYYPTEAPTFSDILTYLTQEFLTDRTLITDASYLSTVASPSVASASYAIYTLESVVSDITTVLSAITYVISAVPSVSCAESLIASYAQESPTLVLTIFDAVQSPTVISGYTTYIQQLTASYPTLVSAIQSIVSIESSYSVIYYYEESFIYAASIDGSILAQYSTFSYQTASNSELYQYSATYSVCSF